MLKRVWYEWLLTVVFAAMVVLCIFLNLTPGHQESVANIIVNVAMFVIVALMFLWADFKSFGPMNSIIRDLNSASEKIKKDAMNTHSYLWEPYQSGNVELFKNHELQEIFQDFLFELNRENDAENSYYRPSIDDYINENLVDRVMRRNELNQYAGALTGLGILGTFIGLSLGLEHFNTGTTAQMTESIEPLMNGIKVAFHTSIYGMVFSLVFNAIYKKKLYEAEETVNNFVVAFKKYVLPDTSNDGMNRMLVLQEKQLKAVDNVASRLSLEIADILEPHFNSLRGIIVDFENMATRNQTEAMKKVVDVFVESMNESLNNAFWQLSKSVDEQYQSQKENAVLMEEVLKATGSSAGNLNDINRETEKLITTLNKYSESIQKVLDELQHTVMALRRQNDESKDVLTKEQDTLKEQGNLLYGFQNAVMEFTKNTQGSSEQMSYALMQMSDSLDMLRRSFDRTQKQAPKGDKR